MDDIYGTLFARQEQDKPKKQLSEIAEDLERTLREIAKPIAKKKLKDLLLKHGFTGNAMTYDDEYVKQEKRSSEIRMVGVYYTARPGFIPTLEEMEENVYRDFVAKLSKMLDPPTGRMPEWA